MKAGVKCLQSKSSARLYLTSLSFLRDRGSSSERKDLFWCFISSDSKQQPDSFWSAVINNTYLGICFVKEASHQVVRFFVFALNMAWQVVCTPSQQAP